MIFLKKFIDTVCNMIASVSFVFAILLWFLAAFWVAGWAYFKVIWKG